MNLRLAASATGGAQLRFHWQHGFDSIWNPFLHLTAVREEQEKKNLFYNIVMPL